MATVTWKVDFKSDGDGVLRARYPDWMANQNATVDTVTRYMERRRFTAQAPVSDGDIVTVIYIGELDPSLADKDLSA